MYRNNCQIIRSATLTMACLLGCARAQNSPTAASVATVDQVIKAANPSLVIVSDLDDTIKISDVNHFEDLVRNSLLSTKSFAGMGELLRGMVEKTKRGTIRPAYVAIVSGSPTQLEILVKHFLAKNEIPFSGLFMRDWKKYSDVAKYKIELLQQMKLGSLGVPLILLGDDTEKDPEVYEDIIHKQALESKTTTYIRQVRGRVLPKSQVPFRTAFEIAHLEVVAGRLSLEDAVKVGNAVLNARAKDILPEFASCPDLIKNQNSPKYAPAVLEELRKKIDLKIKQACSAPRD